MLIRSMSPDILIVDEIGSKEDVQALMEAVHAGVVVICTIHGQTLAELKRRPSLQPIFEQNIFQRYIVLEKSLTPGKIKHIFNQHEVNVFQKSRCLQNEVDWSTSFHHRDNMGRI